MFYQGVLFVIYLGLVVGAHRVQILLGLALVFYKYGCNIFDLGENKSENFQ
jgi:hypothetical protein